MPNLTEELIRLADEFLAKQGFIWSKNRVDDYSSNCKLFLINKVTHDDVENYIFLTLVKIPDIDIEKYQLFYMAIDSAHINFYSEDNYVEGIERGQFSYTFDDDFIKYCVKHIDKTLLDEYCENACEALDKYMINFENGMDEYEDAFSSEDVAILNLHIRNLRLLKTDLLRGTISDESKDKTEE